METLVDWFYEGPIIFPEFGIFYTTTPVTPSPSNAVLNPNADVFECKHLEGVPDVPSNWEVIDPEYPSLEGYVYMNGDIGKLPSGAVYPTTPDSLATAASTSSDYSSLNGLTESLETYVQASSPPGGSLADPSPGSDAGIPLDQLKQMLSSQLEYYFSRENLANDAYLLSQMDNDQYVPIWTVANFNQVKKLTKDIKLITEVLRESPNVQVDEEGQKVRPNHKRCIVILREIPDNTPLEEVKALFSGEGCPRLISCEFAHNNSWYVTFESDEDAQKAYRFLREEVREFQGKPIMARIKAKPMNRLPIPPVATMGAAMKNGYRTPPTALYDPNAYQGQQRFLYTNGSSIPPNVNYGNQVHVYTFQQHQPFYPPGMLQPWTPASPAYFDIGSVFSVNGLAPQGPFSKPQGRYVPRNRILMQDLHLQKKLVKWIPQEHQEQSRNKRNQPVSDRGSLSDNVMNVTRHSGNSHSYHHIGVGSSVGVAVGGTNVAVTKSASSSCTTIGKVQPVPAVGVAGDPHHNHSKSPHQAAPQEPVEVSSNSIPSQNTPGSTSLRSDSDDNYRQARDGLSSKEPMPPRHRRRRKEDEVASAGRTSAVVGNTKPSTCGGSPQPVAREAIGPNARGAQFDLEATAFPPLPGLDCTTAVATKTVVPVEPVPVDTSNSHWENRLSDVVKGTAKPKSTSTNTSTKEKDSVNTSPRAASPTSPIPKLPPPVEVLQPQQQQTSQAPFPVLVSPPLPVIEKEVKEVGTGSDAALSSVALTPPSSPDKTVPVAKCMADKSTKTDDTLLTCEASGGNHTSSSKVGEGNSLKQPLPVVSSVMPPASKPIPTTTNAATMTSAVVVTDVTTVPARTVATTTSTSTSTTANVVTPATNTTTNHTSSDTTCSSLEFSGPTRLSYAQVAQHHKEKVERMLREKQTTEQQEKEREKERKKEALATRISQHGDIREPPQREFRDGPIRFMGRGGPRPVYDRERSERGGLRRRDGPDKVSRFREFLRPRSPK
ncbi:la-related protein 4 isoform X2 [Anabrus simplex]|uniref:la-related protein 4 isoform X2 n=1 Tax=Anabrus simplex TaxID=316456 RepID=UPI0034DD4ACA